MFKLNNYSFKIKNRVDKLKLVISTVIELKNQIERSLSSINKSVTMLKKNIEIQDEKQSQFIFDSHVLKEQLSDSLINSFTLSNIIYGQTFSEFKYLLLSLSKDAAIHPEKELELLQSLANNKLINRHIKDGQLTVISCWQKEYWKSLFPDSIQLTHLQLPFSGVPLLDGEAQCLNHICKISDTISNTENLFIINPYIATLLLLHPNILQNTSKNLRNMLIFPQFVSKPLTLEWDDTFSFHEADYTHHWRWAIGNTRSNSIVIINNTLNSQVVTLTFTLWLLNTGTCLLNLYFLNNSWSFNTAHNRSISLDLLIPPGCHRLMFVCKCESQQMENDIRLLKFAIVDLNLNCKDSNTNLVSVRATTG